MEKLKNEIIESLATELNATEESDAKILSAKVESAIREVKLTRNYNLSHSDKFISSDIQKYYSNIRELALYDYNQIGAEGQSSHSENGTSRAYKDRRTCLNGIVALCSVP